MCPLIVLMIFVAGCEFVFQNNILPIAQTKMWTLLYSMRQKSPEVEIPEGSFYDQIPGVNLYVEHKDQKTGLLHDMMIYEVSKGLDNARIILAASGKLSFSEDKTHLFLQLYDGEQFEPLQDQSMISTARKSKFVPYRKESFTEKEIRVVFDANFSRMDESAMQNQYVGKNITQLRQTIDIENRKVDSIGNKYAKDIKESPYFGLTYYKKKYVDHQLVDVPQGQVILEDTLNLDTLRLAKGNSFARTYLTQALNKAKRHKQDYEFKSLSMKDQRKSIRRHDIEMQKKFTLSFACIIFFFIGAPLGAIIKKGGIGSPLVISVILFIIYYIIDNTGYKMARDGRIAVWAGMWVSSAVLLPLGVFFTYKAVNDSAVFNMDAYRNFFRKIFGGNAVRHYEIKEVVIDDVVPSIAVNKANSLTNECISFLEKYNKRQSYIEYWINGYSRQEMRDVDSNLEMIVSYLTNTKDQLLINKISQYPILKRMWLCNLTQNKIISWLCIILLPIGMLLYLMGLKSQKRLKQDLMMVCKVNRDVVEILESKEL